MAIDASSLDALSLFTEVGRRSRRQLARISDEVRVASGSALFEEGSPADDIYVVLEGRLALSLRLPGRSAMTLLTLGPSEVTGWSAILGGPRVATARVVDDARLLRIPGEALSALCERDHELGYRVMKTLAGELARRLREARLQLLDVYGELDG